MGMHSLNGGGGFLRSLQGAGIDRGDRRVAQRLGGSLCLDAPLFAQTKAGQPPIVYGAWVVYVPVPHESNAYSHPWHSLVCRRGSALGEFGADLGVTLTGDGIAIDGNKA